MSFERILAELIPCISIFAILSDKSLIATAKPFLFSSRCWAIAPPMPALTQIIKKVSLNL